MRGASEVVAPGWVWTVGGDELSGPGDCLVFLVDLGELVLIDCGLGPSWPRIAANIESTGHDPGRLHTLVLTHCHVDHVGAAAAVAAETGCGVLAHALDAEAIEAGDPRRTAADWYGIDLAPVRVGRRVEGEELTIEMARAPLLLLHAPGHTPGSMVAVVETPSGRVLFGQDVHGPFSEAFGSDLAAWRRSMARLLALEADVLCEGHYGVIRPAAGVRRFVEGQLARQSSQASSGFGQ